MRLNLLSRYAIVKVGGRATRNQQSHDIQRAFLVVSHQVGALRRIQVGSNVFKATRPNGGVEKDQCAGTGIVGEVEDVAFDEDLKVFKFVEFEDPQLRIKLMTLRCCGGLYESFVAICYLFSDVVLEVSVAMADMRHITWKAHERLRFLANIPQDLRNRVPKCHRLFRLCWLQKFLQRHRFLLRAVVKNEIFDDEGLNDRLKATRCIFGATKAKGMLS